MIKFALIKLSAMEGLPGLFSDLALILVTAGVITIIFKWLKQPLVLGYIVAGFLIGPYFTFFPVVTDHASVEIWSEIGMVFLLFAIGLEFSFKKLKKVAGTVGITALTELISMCIIGFFLGKILGWQQMDCIFLGAMLSMSSTTIIAKAFDDLKMKNEKFTHSVIGVLVVEDIAAILMMVILSTLSVSTALDGRELGFSVLKLVFFLLVWYIGGMFLIPSLLKVIRKFMSEETLTIISVGLCFMMVVLANIAGFSSALGAFIMGSILAETLESDMINKLTTPIRDLFGAVFFVSVGMMVDPQILIQYWWQIIVVTIVVLSLKTFFSGFGMILAGNSLHNAVRAGCCFGQIGEFSFIIATVGMSYGVIDDFLYPIIVSVSVITTFTTPYAIKLGDPLYEKIYERIPERWAQGISNKETGLKVNSGEQINMQAFFIRQIKNLVIYAAIVIAVMLICFSLCAIIIKYVANPWAEIISTMITLIVLSPFLWAIAFKHSVNHTSRRLIKINKLNQTIILSVFILRFVIVWGFSTNIINHFIGGLMNFWISFGLGLVYVVLLRMVSPAMKFYKRIESQFLDNLNKKQSFEVPEPMQGMCHLDRISLSQNNAYVGKRMIDTDFRQKYQVSVVSIERGSKVIDLPSKDELLFPFDKLVVVGNDDSINALRGVLESNDGPLIGDGESDMNMYSIDITSNSPFCRKSLRDAGFISYKAMVIALNRGGDFIINPPASTVFADGDVVWYVADEKSAKMISSGHPIVFKNTIRTKQ